MVSNDFSMWVNGHLLTFDPQEDTLWSIPEGNLKLKLKLHQNNFDKGQVSVVMGGEGLLPGFRLRLYETAEGELQAQKSGITQLAGQKLLGLTSLELFYRDLPVAGGCTQIRFEPGLEVQRQAEYMREALQQVNATVFDFYGLAKEVFFANMESGWNEYDLELEGFLLLYQFFQLASPFFRADQAMLDSKLVDNHDGQTVPIHRSHPLTSYILAAAYRNKEPFYLNRNNTVLQEKMATTMVALPMRVPVSRRVISYNTNSNQQAMVILHEVNREAEKVVALIDTELRQKASLRSSLYGGYADFTDFKLQRLRAARRLSSEMLYSLQERMQLLTQLGVQISPGGRRLTSSIKPIYAALFRAFNDYRAKVALSSKIINVSDSAFPLQTYSINHLYEIWVVYTLARVMVERLGFLVMDDEYDQPEVINFRPFPLLKSGQTLNLMSPRGQRVLFHYDKKYPSFENPFCLEQLGFMPVSLAGEDRVSKNNPDIAIEFYTQADNPPSILIFDATFSNNPSIHHQKSYYEDTIRFRPSIDAPRGQWEQPVCQAIAVHPFPSDDGLPRRREAILIPAEGANDKAEAWLRKLMEKERLI